MECPKCGSDDLYDRWTKGRQLQRGCRDCSWKEPPRTPEKRKISIVKTISSGSGWGFCYEIYDQYGYTIVFSKSYETSEEARAVARDEAEKLEKRLIYGPCTTIVWPPTAEVVGEIVLPKREETDG